MNNEPSKSIDTALDNIDCPTKLENFEDIRADDSWFKRQSHPSFLDNLKEFGSDSSASGSSHSNILHSIDENKVVGQSTATSVSEPADGKKELARKTRILKSSSSLSSKCSEDDTAAVPAEASSAGQQQHHTEQDENGKANNAVKLATEQRSKKRSEWKQLMQRRERLREEQQMRRKQSMTRREQEQVKAMRAAAVHRAQPIRRYKSVSIKRSEKPLTVAKSPDFTLKRRHADSAAQHHCSSSASANSHH